MPGFMQGYDVGVQMGKQIAYAERLIEELDDLLFRTQVGVEATALPLEIRQYLQERDGGYEVSE